MSNSSSYAFNLLSFILGATFLLFAGCSGGQEKGVQLKLGHVLSPQHPVHKAMVKWADEVEKKSDGEVQIKIYESGKFGQEKELIEKTKKGIVDITKVSSAALESFVAEMKLYNVPYLFKNKEHKWNVLEGDVGQAVLDALETKQMKGIGYYEAGSRSFYTTDKAIRTPADLKNLKIRVQKSQMANELMEHLGASPTPISWGELYSALNQGIIAGAENNPPSFVTSGHYEVCQYYTLDEHTSPMDVVVMSRRTWKNLDPEHRKLLKETFQNSVSYQRNLWKEEVQENMKTIKEAGVDVIKPDKSKFQDAVSGLHDKYREHEVLGEYVRSILDE